MRKIILIFIFSLFTATSLFSQGDGLLNTTVALTGNVFNEVTKLPETVKIMVTDSEGNRIGITRSNASDNGAYYITGLKPGVSYKVKIKKSGFMKETFNVKVPKTDKYLEISQDFMVKPMEKGVKIKISVPPFELNKSKLRFGSDYFLEGMKNALKQNENISFTILCYPDKENAGENMQLTNERAKSLQEYFIENGIDASRIKTKGSKATDPDNPPPTKRAAKGKRYIGTSYIEINGV